VEILGQTQPVSRNCKEICLSIRNIPKVSTTSRRRKVGFANGNKCNREN